MNAAAIDIQRIVFAWQSLQSIVQLTHINSEIEYARAIALLNNLLDIVRDDVQHPLYSLISVLGDVIGAYEIDHDPF